MCVGDLPGNDRALRPGGGKPLHQRRKRPQQPAAHHRTAQVEDGVGRRHPLGIFPLPDGCQHRRDRGADVIPQQHRDGPGKAQQAVHAVRARLGGHRLQHGNGGRTALHGQGHAKARQQTEGRVCLHPHQPLPELRAFGQRLQGTAHDRDALEQQPETEQRFACAAALLVLAGKAEQHPAEQQQVPPLFHLKGQQLGCDRGADVGPEHHRHGLPQLQQTRRQKGDDHHRDGGTALHHRRHGSTGHKPGHRVRRAPGQQAAQPLARPQLDGAAHAVHAVQKQRQPAKKLQDHGNILHPFHLTCCPASMFMHQSGGASWKMYQIVL